MWKFEMFRPDADDPTRHDSARPPEPLGGGGRAEQRPEIADVVERTKSKLERYTRERRRELIRQEALKRLHDAEAELDRALAHSDEAAYLAARFAVKESELPFWHYFDLDAGLTALNEIRTVVPEEYERNAAKIRAGEASIRAILEGFRTWRPKDAEAQQSLMRVIVGLRRVAPDQFASESIEVTDDEYRSIYARRNSMRDPYPAIEATLAEYDPERFRRLFARDYPAARRVELRASYAQRDRENKSALGLPRYGEAWDIIERALESPEGSASDARTRDNGIGIDRAANPPV
jgi:hypothetical protein